MTFVVSQATVFLFGIRMKKLFVLSACLLVGTCLAQSGDMIKTYHVVNQSHRVVKVRIRAPKTIKNNVISDWHTIQFELPESYNSQKTGEIQSLKDESLTDDIIGVAVSSSFWGRPQYQTFRAAQSTGIYCIVDQSLALSCDFNAESREK